MYLTLDIGNTRVKAGLFEDNRLVRHTNWSDVSLHDLPDWLGGCALRGVVVASVVADAPDLDWLRARTEVWELTAQTALPFRNAYRTPETLGKDRVAAVAGAQALFPGRDCLVVDCGTCIKYEWLTAAGVYEGGNIAPGLRMRIQAMHAFTARLPEVEIEMPASPIGDSTVTALQNGALRGAVM
jgi:type III pantothenate kinase